MITKSAIRRMADAVIDAESQRDHGSTVGRHGYSVECDDVGEVAIAGELDDSDYRIVAAYRS